MKRIKKVLPEQSGKHCACGAPWEFEQNTLFDYQENEYYCAPCYKKLCEEVAIETEGIEQPAAAVNAASFEQVTLL